MRSLVGDVSALRFPPPSREERDRWLESDERRPSGGPPRVGFRPAEARTAWADARQAAGYLLRMGVLSSPHGGHHDLRTAGLLAARDLRGLEAHRDRLLARAGALDGDADRDEHASAVSALRAAASSADAAADLLREAA